jgi:uncharacterized protein YjbJ (UPF0337 family)
MLIGEQSGVTIGPKLGIRVNHGGCMNKDQIKGKAKDIGGKIQEKVGEAVGNRQQQSEGLSNQAEGKVQKKVGDVKEIAKGNR